MGKPVVLDGATSRRCPSDPRLPLDEVLKAFYSDTFVLPLPEGHRFPMRKYSRLRERLLEEGIVTPQEMALAPAIGWDELRLVHTPEYVAAVASGTLPAAMQRRIGFPWS